MNNKDKEIEILNLQNIATLIYIVSLIISIYITNNDKERLLNNKVISKNIGTLAIFNRTLVVILTIIFLYISIQNKKIASSKRKNLNLFNLQISASSLSLISTLIVLYVVIKSSGENYTVISGVSNPNL